MKVLLTGCNGLVGQRMVELFARCSSIELVLSSRHEQSWYEESDFAYRQLDISVKKMVRSVVDEVEPDIIVNAAAAADVDLCERERGLAWQTNVYGVENLVQAAKITGAAVIHVSTDYVFDGKNGPYDEYARPNPINYYGKTKLAAENILNTSGIPHAILRTLFLYGAGHSTRATFAQRVLETLEAGETVKVPDDQYSNPTLADDVAYAALKVIELGKYGTYHIGGPQWVSRYEFARQIASAFGHEKKRIVAVKMASLKSEAQRPIRSGFITLKSTIDLDLKGTPVEQGLLILKSQREQYAKQPDETAAP